MLSDSQTWALLGALVTAIIGTGGWWAARLIWVRAFLARVEIEVRHVVLSVEQVYVDAWRAAKDPGSPGGVELTAEERAEALALAVDRLEELLGIATLNRALRILGLPTAPAFVRGWLVTRVEAHVKLMSLEQAS